VERIFSHGGSALAGALVGGLPGAVLGALAPFLADCIDMFSHPDEPLNPLLGGDYEGWYD